MSVIQSGVGLIAAERQRQIESEGWDWSHDDEHQLAEMARAAACYALPAPLRGVGAVPNLWPWDEEWWKPGDRVRELAKAGALIAAEIDRLLRLNENEEAECEP